MTYDFSTPAGQRLLAAAREACRELPGVEEVVDGFGHHTFKAGGRSFLIAGMGSDAGTLSIKQDTASQALLVRRGPYRRTPYIGQHGWISVDDPLAADWDEVQELIRDGYMLAAPKKLRKLLPETP